ncbi:hypothetical protein WJX73_003145 [Symbiochloris irregularis]|uniref:Uncharacterized protein n=1 Tax=Symbiochloris irregularis TaxID=706552 RepID=A0AAW1P901_9CHLO
MPQRRAGQQQVYHTIRGRPFRWSEKARRVCAAGLRGPSGADKRLQRAAIMAERRSRRRRTAVPRLEGLLSLQGQELERRPAQDTYNNRHQMVSMLWCASSVGLRITCQPCAIPVT